MGKMHVIVLFEGKNHPKMKSQQLSFSSISRWEVELSFVFHQTFLELHGETTLQYSPEQFK